LQTKFRTNVLAFVEVVEQLGNPFNNGKDLVALHTQEVMEEEVVTSLTQLQNLGKDLHAEFLSHTIEQVTLPITPSNAKRFSPLPNVLSTPRTVPYQAVLR